MPALSITKLYEVLSAKIGKETAENLTTFIEEKIKTEVENHSQTLATKGDLHLLRADLHQTGSALKADLHLTEAALKDDIRKVDTKISEVKSETIKWMFLFWVGQVAVTFGFILLFLKK